MELLRDPSHVRNASLDEWKATLASLGFEVARVATYKLRLAFAPWVERTRTPAGHAAAIRSLQQTGLEVGSINDVTPSPHNGCRPPKRRRV